MQLPIQKPGLVVTVYMLGVHVISYAICRRRITYQTLPFHNYHTFSSILTKLHTQQFVPINPYKLHPMFKYQFWVPEIRLPRAVPITSKLNLPNQAGLGLKVSIAADVAPRGSRTAEIWPNAADVDRFGYGWFSYRF
jgi:hypothetical protein